MNLFQDKVYALLEERLKQHSVYTGIENDLLMIRRDLKLQDFLRAFAKRNGIHQDCFGMYGQGCSCAGNFRPTGKIILYETDNIGLDFSLHIGYDPIKRIMPIFFLKIGDDWCDTYKLVEKRNRLYLSRDPFWEKIGDERHGRVDNKRITEITELVDIPNHIILSNLENEIKRISGLNDHTKIKTANLILPI